MKTLRTSASGMDSTPASAPEEEAGEPATANGVADNPLDDFMAEPPDAEVDLNSAPHALHGGGAVLASKLEQRHEHPLLEAAPPPFAVTPRRSIGLPLLALLLLAGTGAATWRMHIVEAERDDLLREVRMEAAAHRKTQLAARTAQMDLASARRELADELKAAQGLRSGVPKPAAQAGPQSKGADTGCVTPPSILRGRGL